MFHPTPLFLLFLPALYLHPPLFLEPGSIKEGENFTWFSVRLMQYFLCTFTLPFFSSCFYYLRPHSDKQLNLSLIYVSGAFCQNAEAYLNSRSCIFLLTSLELKTFLPSLCEWGPNFSLHLFSASFFPPLSLHLSPLGGLRARLHSSSSVPNFLKFPFLAPVQENDCPEPKRRYTHTYTK